MSDATVTLRGSLARAIRRELARLGILIAAEYRVVTQTGPYVELQIVRATAGLPNTSRVLSRPSAGYAPTYQLGSLVLVAFVQGDPTRPFIAFGPEVGSSTPPAVTIDASGALTFGPSASSVQVGSGGTSTATGLEVTQRRVVCYGDNIAGLTAAGGVVTGAIIQNPATAPICISRVRA